MKLVFKSGSEMFGFDIDRQKRKLKISSSKTNYRYVQVPYTHLFDKGKERIQDKLTRKMSDKNFIICISQKMANLGYKNVG